MTTYRPTPQRLEADGAGYAAFCAAYIPGSWAATATPIGLNREADLLQHVLTAAHLRLDHLERAMPPRDEETSAGTCYRRRAV